MKKKEIEEAGLKFERWSSSKREKGKKRNDCWR
jgi:hypothetical protein